MTRDAGPGAEVPDTKIGEDTGTLNHVRDHTKDSGRARKVAKARGPEDHLIGN